MRERGNACSIVEYFLVNLYDLILENLKPDINITYFNRPLQIPLIWNCCFGKLSQKVNLYRKRR